MMNMTSCVASMLRIHKYDLVQKMAACALAAISLREDDTLLLVKLLTAYRTLCAVLALAQNRHQPPQR